jgi:catechol 2,3-dioxygenase-like lactoylglutathione lyase family enzyme
MTSTEFASGSPLAFALISVASIEASLRFYRDRLGLAASEVVERDRVPAGFVDGTTRAARLAMCGEPGTDAGRVLLVEFAGGPAPTVRQAGDRTTRGLWNLNFYVDDIHASTRELRAAGFEFWSDPVTYRVGDAAGIATEVVFEGPDGVAINLVQPQGGPDTFTGRVLAEVRRHGKTATGFTPVATTAHCVRDLAAASAFYRDVLGMRVVLDEYLGRPETNRFLARPADARTHTMFVAGAHFYGKVALNEPQNFAVPERAEDGRAPRVGYLAQGFAVPDLDRAAALWTGERPRRLHLEGIPGLPDGPALQGFIPGSGALALLVQSR